jgi:hypothetical protein
VRSCTSSRSLDQTCTNAASASTAACPVRERQVVLSEVAILACCSSDFQPRATLWASRRCGLTTAGERGPSPRPEDRAEQAESLCHRARHGADRVGRTSWRAGTLDMGNNLGEQARFRCMSSRGCRSISGSSRWSQIQQDDEGGWCGTHHVPAARRWGVDRLRIVNTRHPPEIGNKEAVVLIDR